LAAHAQAELEHIKSLPPTSHKWTWGVDITENNVLASNQKTKGKGKSHHSGYVWSLPHGVYKKEWSITASIPTVSAAYSQPPTVTGIDAGLYFSDAESSHANTESNAAPTPAPAAVAIAVPTPAANVNMTASDASMAWQGEQPTAFQAAIVWQGDDDHDNSSPHTASPTAFDAAAFFSANSTSSSPSTHTAAFSTASDTADLFLSFSDTNSAGSHDSNANANADTNAESNVEDISSAESPTTSQIERCTPSRITLLIYSHADFSYIDDTWLPGSDDMMDTSENE
jgi:hypothetical protein